MFYRFLLAIIVVIIMSFCIDEYLKEKLDEDSMNDDNEQEKMLHKVGN